MVLGDRMTKSDFHCFICGSTDHWKVAFSEHGRSVYIFKCLNILDVEHNDGEGHVDIPEEVCTGEIRITVGPARK